MPFSLLSSSNKPYIVAEIGSNHDQSMERAKSLIDIAVQAGCDAVKFQLFNASVLYPTDLQMRKVFESVEFDQDWLEPLIQYAHEKNTHFIVSCFDSKSLQNPSLSYVDAIKVASSEVTNIDILHLSAKLGKPLLLSTGMSDFSDVARMVSIISSLGIDDYALMQCTSLYPTEANRVNLNVLKAFDTCFRCTLGLSDHTLRNVASVAAVALGARVLEKHITLDKSSAGPDHSYALEPHELESYVRDVHEAFVSLGSSNKLFLDDEKQVARRQGIYLKTPLPYGTRLERHHLKARRPCFGIPSYHLEDLIGCTLTKSLTSQNALTWNDVSFVQR